MKKIWTTTRADREFSHWIRDRDKKCYFCSNDGKQASHYWGRQISATRYHPDNVDAICGGCHMRHESNKAGLYRDKKMAQLGEKRYNALRKLAFQSGITRRQAIIECMKLITL